MTKTEYSLLVQSNGSKTPFGSTHAFWGASRAEWLRLFLLGLTEDLLPVVSNPNANISVNSSLKKLGKTPSLYNRNGFVTGIKNWTAHKTSDAELDKWMGNNDLGICLQTRHVRALDIDIPDRQKAAAIRNCIQAQLHGLCLPMRYRSDSGNCLLAFRLEGELSKRIIAVDGGIIELLADGNQFVAAGTHPDGARYEWQYSEAGYDFPELSREEFENLWSFIVRKFGVSAPTGSETAQMKGKHIDIFDPVVPFLRSNPAFLREETDGKILISCPFKDQHSCESGETETAYLPRGWNGNKKGRFKCMHAHCRGKSNRTFEAALGYAEPNFRRYGKKTRDGTGLIVAELSNLELALTSPTFCGCYLRTDTFRDEVMMASLDAPDVWEPLSDAAQVQLRKRLEQLFFATIGRELMRDAILDHADRHKFDSAKAWLSGLKWDGVGRVKTFVHEYLGADDDEYTRAVSLYWWTAMAGRVMQPGVKADMVPILVGPQGCRKSSAVRALVPLEDMFAEIDLGDKDDNLARLMRGKLVAEIAELRGLHSRDLESNKAFVARQYENWIPKYREFATSYPRRLIFVGTTNEEEFLADPTGNRRWLPVTVPNTINIDRIIQERGLLWAEARELFSCGGIDWSAEKLAGGAHEKHTMNDPWDEQINQWLDKISYASGESQGTPRERGFTTVADVAVGALEIPVKKCQRIDQMRIANCLKRLGFRKYVGRINGNKGNWWVTREKFNELNLQKTM